MSTKKQATKRPVGRPPSGLPPRQRRFLQVERNIKFDDDLKFIRQIIAIQKGVNIAEVSQTEAIRAAVDHYANLL